MSTAFSGDRDEEVAPGVWPRAFLTPTLPPATHTNSFVVGGDRAALLIEPACESLSVREATLRWAGRMQRRGLKLEAITLTHAHPDHIGGAQFLADALGLPLWAHEAAVPALRTRFPDLLVSRMLSDGERVHLGENAQGPVSVQALHTPGHAPGHLSFWLPASKTLIAGDMVAATGTILIDPSDGDMALYLESLRRLKRLDARVLIPAHGRALESPNAVLSHYIEHRLARELRVLQALLDAGRPASPEDLVPQAYADAPSSVWGLAARATESHLLKLARDGLATFENGFWRPA